MFGFVWVALIPPLKVFNSLRNYLGLDWFKLTLTQRIILASSKLTEFADDNFRFDETDEKFFKRVEKTVGLQKGRKNCGKKEKLLVTSNFSFSHKVFELQARKNKALFGKGIKAFADL